jgi:hypothetical protein
MAQEPPPQAPGPQALAPQAPAPPPQAAAAATGKPIQKVTVGILAGAIVTVLIWALRFVHVTVTPEVAAALTTIVSFIISYLTPPHPSETTTTDQAGNPKSARVPA